MTVTVASQDAANARRQAEIKRLVEEDDAKWREERRKRKLGEFDPSFNLASFNSIVTPASPCQSRPASSAAFPRLRPTVSYAATDARQLESSPQR